MWQTGVAILIEEAPEVEFRGGMFYITDRIGDLVICRVFRPHTFLKTVARFGTTAGQFDGGAEVVAIGH